MPFYVYVPLSRWEPLTLPYYTYVPFSEWKLLTVPFNTSKHLTVLETLSYVPCCAFEPVSVLSLLSLFSHEPYYAIKPDSVLSPLSLVVNVLGDPHVPVLCCMLVTNDGSLKAYSHNTVATVCKHTKHF